MFEALDIPVQQSSASANTWDYHWVRCTGSRNFRDRGPRTDWVWVRVGTELQYGLLRGHLPGKILALFTVHSLESEEDSSLALVQLTRVKRNGTPKGTSGLVEVVERPKEDRDRDILVGIEKLVGMAHLVQDGKNYKK